MPWSLSLSADDRGTVPDMPTKYTVYSTKHAADNAAAELRTAFFCTAPYAAGNRGPTEVSQSSPFQRRGAIAGRGVMGRHHVPWRAANDCLALR
jgi:hypothetical protein